MNQREFLEYIDNFYTDALAIVNDKNHDYAGEQDPFKNFYNVERMGIVDAKTAILVRLCDKFTRITNFIKQIIMATLQELQQKPAAQFIFSSSCTVYGQAENMPITEDAPIQTAMSPYGNTKQIGEEIIKDVAKVSTINAILLRYFNPIGAHESAEIGELPLGVPQNLVPFITQPLS